MTWCGPVDAIAPLLSASPVPLWLVDAGTGEVLATNSPAPLPDGTIGAAVDLDSGPAFLHALHAGVIAGWAEAIVDGAGDAILTVDPAGAIASVNPATERLFGCPAAELVGRPVSEVVAGADAHALSDLPREATGRRADGSTFPLELAVTDIVLGEVAITTVVARDLTDRRAGTHDPLTGLPNRRLLLERLGGAVARSSRTGRPLAVLFCDLDRFKVVNDSLGHAAGDELLVEVATRFRAAVRAGDTVARFGGDEFVVLAEDLTDGGDADRVANQLHAALAAPVRAANQELVVSASIGIAVTDSDAASGEDLLRDADAAMYRAKEGGRGRHELFDGALRRRALARLDTESALRRAVRDGAFEVHYQPEVALDTGVVVGVEALVRWRLPDGRLVAPGSFLAVAEETGLIVPIGEAVLAEACHQAAGWQDALGAPRLWVNVSARQLADPELVGTIAAVADAELPTPAGLGLEITETDLRPDDDAIAAAVGALDDLGVGVAMDDFGTGYASLSSLWRFPASVIKIDGSFVARLGDERDATVIVKSIVDLARSLGKTTVAEGVEHDHQLARLRRLGCDVGQGYLLGRPVPAEEMTVLVRGEPAAV